MLFLTLAVSLFVPDQGAGPPMELQLFASEAWYKETKGEVTNFTGVLKKTERRKGIVGFGRFNPFRLEMDGGKVREVYVGGNLKILDSFVGKKITLVGKAVDMEVEGRMHQEIWPASLVLFRGEPKKAEKGDSLKIYARTPARIGAGPGVIRSAEQLAKLQNTDADQATARLAKMFKVVSIDWKKQMVVVISGGSRPTGGYSVEAKSLEVKGEKLIVHWKLNTPAPGSFVTQAFTNPTLTILVDRFEGDVVFDPKAPPAGKGKKFRE